MDTIAAVMVLNGYLLAGWGRLRASASRDNDAGATTLEIVIIILVLIALATALTVVLTSAVQRRLDQIN